ncbi:MAG: hypothetical protein Q8L14_26055 [Myxococcales bacterium]|nr:hypothetical protein [Myxococcales bacterium]
MRLLLAGLLLSLFACEVPEPDPDEPMGGGTAGTGGGMAAPFTPAFTWYSVTGAVVPLMTVKCTTRGTNGVTGEMMNSQPATQPPNAMAVSTLTVPGQLTFGGGTINSTLTVTPSGNTVTARFQATGTASSGPRPTDDTSCSASTTVQLVVCPSAVGSYPVTLKLRGSGTEASQSTSSSLLNATVSGGNINLQLASVGTAGMLPREVTKTSANITKTVSGGGDNCPVVNIQAALNLNPTAGGSVTAVSHTLTTDLTTVFEISSP